MSKRVKPDGLIDRGYYDEDSFARSTILRVIQQHADMYGRRALAFDDGESEAAQLALLQLRARFEEADDGE